jgi:ribosomal protein L11 methylase PrmA
MTLLGESSKDTITWSFRNDIGVIDRGVVDDSEFHTELRNALLQAVTNQPPRVLTSVLLRSRCINIQSNLEFGTGIHQSTISVLNMMSRFFIISPLCKVLDVGSGSGILGVTSALMGAKRVDFLDSRPSAVKTSVVNAWKNNKNHERSFIYRKLNGQRIHGRYDLVLSNNIASMQKTIIRSVMQSSVVGGIFILGGIEQSRFREIKSFCATFGLRTVAEMKGSKWNTLALIRGRRDAVRLFNLRTRGTRIQVRVRP